jgi:4-amino-4-deoxy-L-arabinose transferase-like glycosyltransferase
VSGTLSAMSTVAARLRTHGAVAALLAATALLYLCGLSASGYGNTFYAAAAEAGAQSWKAWFFGALDARDFITVDKPPAATWITGLSVRLFGMNSWAVLVPQALMGVAAVALLYATVRRACADRAGATAAALLACTPAAALMFRFDNPDALLVLLLVAAAYCLTRAVEAASWRWLAGVGALVGVAFLTKMLQAFLVTPAFAVTYALFAPATWRRRLGHLSIGVGALVLAAGWWVATVQLVPATARPYIGGSTDNSVLDLAFGYNGLARITGGTRDMPAVARAQFGGRAGLHRLFSAEMANEVSWLLPAALVALVFGGYLLARRQLGRTEGAAVVMWGGWLVVTALVFDYMSGTVHPYYTVALAPAVAALTGLGGGWAWRRRSGADGRIAIAAMSAVTAGWSALLLSLNRFGPSWLPKAIVVVAVAAVLACVFRRAVVAGSVVGALAALAGPAVFSVATAATPHHGTIPSAIGRTGTSNWMGDEAANAELAALLAATHTRWSAATNGSQSASVLEVASGTPVMAIGGWSGDPVPTLPQFIADVHAGDITYYVEAGRPAARHGEVIREPSRTAAHTREIADWVAAHYPAETVGTSTVYRLA